MIFEKVSYKEWKRAMLKLNSSLNDEQMRETYDRIKLPERSTKNSAGYDFRIPYRVYSQAGVASDLYPTGIKCKLDSDKVLLLLPRSSLGCKHGFRLMNTVGVIDADYYGNEDNEGHIFVKFKTDVDFCLNENEKLFQGLVVKFFSDEKVDKTRAGGFGSTD